MPQPNYRSKAGSCVVVALLTCLSALLSASPAAAKTSHKRHPQTPPTQPATPAAVQPPAPAAPIAPVATKLLGASPGQTAPDFALTDTDGKSWHLADLTAAGKTVVLEWFSPICPACEAYYKQGDDGSPSRMEQIIAGVAGDDLVWLAINSGGGAEGGGDPALNSKTRLDWHVGPPVLLDPTGTVGHAYGAERTPTICIISPKGKYVFRGAPDEPEIGPGLPAIDFVARALGEIRAGQPVTIMETRCFG